jgi:SAM-dependent methyltransferase
MNPFQNWTTWAQTPLGLKLVAEEQAWMDATLQDVFGYHALQIAPEPLDALRMSRMSCRTRIVWPQSGQTGQTAAAAADLGVYPEPDGRACQVVSSVTELPFLTQSLDLLVLSHTLEVTNNPHQLLREADRVLIPEGKLVITGFNPVSLWALRKKCRSVQRFPPAAHVWIALPRLKDWLKLLNFDIGAGAASAYGGYIPPVDSERWLDRLAWMEPAGRRWWPMAGGAYFLMAIKRVHGMRLITPAWRDTARAGKRAVASAPVKARQGQQVS